MWQRLEDDETVVRTVSCMAHRGEAKRVSGIVGKIESALDGVVGVLSVDESHGGRANESGVFLGVR